MQIKRIAVFIFTIIMVSAVSSKIALSGNQSQPTKEEIIVAARFLADEYFSQLNMLRHCNLFDQTEQSKSALELYEGVNKPIIDKYSSSFLVYLHNHGYARANEKNYYRILDERSHIAFYKLKDWYFSHDHTRSRLMAVCQKLQKEVLTTPFTDDMRVRPLGWGEPLTPHVNTLNRHEP